MESASRGKKKCDILTNCPCASVGSTVTRDSLSRVTCEDGQWWYFIDRSTSCALNLCVHVWVHFVTGYMLPAARVPFDKKMKENEREKAENEEDHAASSRQTSWPDELAKVKKRGKKEKRREVERQQVFSSAMQLTFSFSLFFSSSSFPFDVLHFYSLSLDHINSLSVWKCWWIVQVSSHQMKRES